MTWTKFWDMHSGGGLKEPPYERIYIQAPQAEAETIFYNRFGHNPNRVSCTCCGEDYAIDEYPTLDQASAYERGCHYDGALKAYVERPSEGPYSSQPYKTTEAYLLGERSLFIWDEDIKPEERQGEVPRQGYVWCD